MQVSHLAMDESHAIIGGGQAQAFKMADTAEFFAVLYDTLYKDKLRAAVRETICNAWDSHIASGLTDTPVKVTIADGELRVQDFGAGIPHSLIGEIYCVVGASTKVADDTQTGGFGLGCKAPYSIADHFTVINSHGGQRTIYTMVKSAPEAQGKPSWRPMVTTATTETGVTVAIPLGDHKTYEVESLAREIAHDGGMRVELNGKDVHFLDYTEARKTGYMIRAISPGNNCRVRLLYGTVLYPIDTQDRAIVKMGSQVVDMLGNGYEVILVGTPGEIGIVPSREGLSYTDRTKAEVLRLMKLVLAGARDRDDKAAMRQLAKIHARQYRNDPKTALDATRHGFYSGVAQQAQTSADIALLLAAMRVKRGHARLNPRHIGHALIPFNRDLRRALRRCDKAKVERHDTRVWMRLVRDFGSWKKTYYFEGTSFSRVINPSMFLHFNNQQHSLVIAPTQRDVTEQAKLHRGIAMIIPGLSHASREAIQARCEKFKIEVKFLEGAPPKKREKPKALFQTLRDPHGEQIEAGEGTIWVSGRRETSGRRTRIEYNLPDRSIDALLALYPDAVMALNATEEKRAEKFGLTYFAKVIEPRFKALLKNRTFLYGALIHRTYNHSGWEARKRHIFGCFGDHEVARRLARHDIRLAQVLLPVRLGPIATRDEDYKLGRLAGTLSPSHHLDPALQTAISTAIETVLELPLRGSEIEEWRPAYAGSALLPALNADKLRSRPVEEVVHLLKALPKIVTNTPSIHFED